jgi:hypothetical protein
MRMQTHQCRVDLYLIKRRFDACNVYYLYNHVQTSSGDANGSGKSIRSLNAISTEAIKPEENANGANSTRGWCFVLRGREKHVKGTTSCPGVIRESTGSRKASVLPLPVSPCMMQSELDSTAAVVRACTSVAPTNKVPHSCYLA